MSQSIPSVCCVGGGNESGGGGGASDGPMPMLKAQQAVAQPFASDGLYQINPTTNALPPGVLSALTPPGGNRGGQQLDASQLAPLLLAMMRGKSGV